MSSIKLYLLFILIFSHSCTTAQKLNGNPDDEKNATFISGKFKFFEKDKLGLFYLVDQNDHLIQYDLDGKELFRFNSNRLGTLSQIDVSNPQKVMLFYQDYQAVVFLDNTLSELQIIYLEELGFWNIQTVALSNDNRLWIYDQNQKILHKINSNGDRLLESNTIINFPLSGELMIHMIEKDNKVYMNANGKGLIIFDNLGLYLQSATEIKTKQFQVIEQNLFFLDLKNTFYTWQSAIEGPQNVNFNAIEDNILDFHIENDKYYVLLEDGLASIYYQ